MAKTTTTYTVNGKSGYSDVVKCRTAFAAYTAASLITLGFAQVSKAGAFTRGRRKYSASALRALCGATMVNYWTKSKGRLDDSGLTVAGINELDRRLTDSKYGYRTTRAAIDAFVVGLKTGGDVEVDGFKFHMSEKACQVKKVTQVDDTDNGLGLSLGMS